MSRRSIVRTGAALGAAFLLLVGTASVASAHVTIAEPEHVAGEYTLLTFSVPHGCDGSPTTELRIQIPKEIPQVTPTVNPGWDVKKVMEDLDEPITGGHGAEITQRVSEVVYTAHTPLPADLRDSFELSLQAPDLPGETLYFPTVQKCVEGETAWVEIPSDGVAEDDLDNPAPKIVLVKATDAPQSGHASDSDKDSKETAATAAKSDTPRSEDSGSSNGLAIVALLVGAVGVVLGGASLATRRRSA